MLAFRKEIKGDSAVLPPFLRACYALFPAANVKESSYIFIQHPVEINCERIYNKDRLQFGIEGPVRVCDSNLRGIVGAAEHGFPLTQENVCNDRRNLHREC